MEVPVLKMDDQFPLLSIEGGAGKRARLTPAQISSANVIRKRPWYRRWPDIFSVSWIMILIFGIASILIYSVMLFSPAATMRHTLFFVTPNDTKPGTEVFYHHIIPRGASVPLSLYTDYLNEMASLYPYLKFKVIFLLDDTITTYFRGRPNRSLGVPMACKQWYTYVGEMENFLKNHDNIELNVMSLSSYMAMTPLKHRWRFIPKQDIIFYARIFSVWKFGGIGLDLGVFNNKYNMHQRLDNRIMSILRQHNDGWAFDEYEEIMNQFENEQETVFTQYVMDLLSSLVNETRSLFEFNSTRPIMDQSRDIYRPLVRTHRNKRESSDNNEQITAETTATETTVSKTINSEVHNLSNTTEILNIMNKTSNSSMNTITLENATVQENNDTVTPRITSSKSLVRVSKPFFLFYDISLRNLGSVFPSPSRRDGRGLNAPYSLKHKEVNQYLTLDWAGLFVASPSREHPFLAHLLTAGSQGIDPKLAIETVFMEQCGMYNAYCKYLNFLYL